MIYFLANDGCDLAGFVAKVKPEVSVDGSIIEDFPAQTRSLWSIMQALIMLLQSTQPETQLR
jgi:hypothetical protein